MGWKLFCGWTRVFWFCKRAMFWFAKRFPLTVCGAVVWLAPMLRNAVNGTDPPNCRSNEAKSLFLSWVIPLTPDGAGTGAGMGAWG